MLLMNSSGTHVRDLQLEGLRVQNQDCGSTPVARGDHGDVIGLSIQNQGCRGCLVLPRGGQGLLETLQFHFWSEFELSFGCVLPWFSWL